MTTTSLHTAESIRNATAGEVKGMIRDNINDTGPEGERWLLRGILAIFKRQTEDEQRTEATKEYNGIGFNGFDAAILSSFAKRVIQWQNRLESRRYGPPLSPKQLSIARCKMQKYCGQLARIARG